MQNFSENVRVARSDKLGLNVNAAQDLKPGDVILEELPLFLTAHWDSDRMKCENCRQDSFVMCKKCNFFPLCLNCKSHNEFDCKFMMEILKCGERDVSSCVTNKIGISKDLLVKNYSIYAALKSLLLMENERTRADCEFLFPSLVNLSEEYRTSEAWQDQEEHVIKPLMSSEILPYFQNITKIRGAEIDSEFLHELCYLIDSHAFEVANRQSDESMKAIYSVGTEIPHNCLPNTVISFSDTFKMKIYASVPIQQGEAIYNCYVNPLLGTAHRQIKLHFSRQIVCRCSRCLDPTELGTHLSTLKCKNCTFGFLTSSKPEENGHWACNECSTQMEFDEVNELLSEIAEEITYTDNDVDSYERLLNKYEERFHPHHFIMIDIKQTIASMIGIMLANPKIKLERNFLERKIAISREILPLIRTLQPGISKLYTIALYDSVMTSLELTELKYEKRQIPITEYVESLQRSKGSLDEIVNMLSFEPKNSTEGQLAQRVLLEQKQIEQNVKAANEEVN